MPERIVRPEGERENAVRSGLWDRIAEVSGAVVRCHQPRQWLTADELRNRQHVKRGIAWAENDASLRSSCKGNP